MKLTGRTLEALFLEGDVLNKLGRYERELMRQLERTLDALAKGRRLTGFVQLIGRRLRSSPMTIGPQLRPHFRSHQRDRCQATVSEIAIKHALAGATPMPCRRPLMTPWPTRSGGCPLLGVAAEHP